MDNIAVLFISSVMKWEAKLHLFSLKLCYMLSYAMKYSEI